MPDIDFLFQGYGDVVSPVSALSVGDNLLAGAFDPGAEKLREFIAAVIVAELTPAWSIARVGTALESREPIADTLWRAPTKAALRAQSIPFPALFVERTQQTHEELTLVVEQITTTWAVDYLLGPLTEADLRRLGGALNAVLGFVKLAIRQRHHPAYDNDRIQFGPGYGGFNTVRVVSSQMGPAEFGERGEGLEFHALHIDIETTETDRYADGVSGAFDGFTFTGPVGDATQISPVTLVGKSDVPVQRG